MIRSVLISMTLLMHVYFSARAQPTLSKIWQTNGLEVPESVLISKPAQRLYVSLIGAGDASAMDGNGTIAQLDMDGQVINKSWVTGLNSPKGIANHKNKLYVADLKELVIIDFSNGQVIDKIPVPDAGMLNDVTVDGNGQILVSDSKGGKIYLYKDGKINLFLGDLINPNGILASETGLYFLDSGSLFHLDDQKQVVKIAEGMEKSTDGIQLDGDNFLVSSWIGVLYYIQKDGKVTTLLDHRKEKTNTADFAFDTQSRILYLPTFFKNYVAAYKVE